MKKDTKTQKKLTRVDREKMWGEDGPYSQVRLCEEIRILDDYVSRVFLVIEAEINPFTLEYIQKHRERFARDEAVLQLLDHAEYRGGRFGYVVGAGEIKLEEKNSRDFARKQADVATQTLIRMHTFIMDEFNLREEAEEFEKMMGVPPIKKQLVWNESAGGVQKVDDEFWGDKTYVGSPAGIKNNKVRFYFVLVFGSQFDFKKQTVVRFMQTLMKTSVEMEVEIEDCESFYEHMTVDALVPFDIAPADFIETVINKTNKATKKDSFMKDYYVTNVKKPTPGEIDVFIKKLPLDRDTDMNKEK